MEKTEIAILKILDRATDIIGSREIARRLKSHGIDITERTVRYHLRLMDARGLTRVFGKEGRKITDLGRRELQNATVLEKATFVSSRIENHAVLTGFDPETRKGDIIANVSLVDESRLGETVEIMKRVFAAGLAVGNVVKLVRANDQLGDLLVPDGKVAIATVCSITINGVLLRYGVPVTSRFGGVLEIADGRPERFTALINYEGSSLDPHELFIKARMTNVWGVLNDGFGTVLASYREIPAAAYLRAKTAIEALNAVGMSGVIQLGEPNKPLLGVAPALDRAGMVVLGGLNPIAAAVENGVDIESHAMSVLIPYADLEHVSAIN